ncbi:MAG: DEAD/DEAH box helicase [bacterium]|nr:DEAD/DEAH box helicase [bacterium]
MNIERLTNYDFPEDMIAGWRKLGMNELQPIQAQAILKYKLFNGNSMIVSAPTSSGKTFVGELAAVHQSIDKKKTAFLVPLKAIAEEKFHTFQQMYTSAGIKVVISTRDHKEFDADIENGKFDIAILVYEKFFQLLNSNKGFLSSLGLVVIDELQMLADYSRGTTLEMILTHLRMQRSRLGFQIVGLSAVLGNHRLVNEWLGIDLLHSERRPVELRIGYLYKGVFHFKSMNDHSTGEEMILARPPQERDAVLYSAVAHFSELGEQTLLFLKDKNSVRNIASALAGWVTAPPAEEALAELENLEETHSRDELAVLLQHGVAIHHADMTSEERELVERHYRNRSIQVLVSTTTLAMGVNLPTKNVFIELQQWRYDPKYKKLDTVDLPKGEFENMGGRAGRFQLEDDFGRAIALADSIVEREQIKRFYLEGDLEEIKPNLWRSSMATTVLGVVSLLGGGSIQQIKDYLQNSLSWHVHQANEYERKELGYELEAAINYCIAAEVVIANQDDRLTLTEFGVAVAGMGIRVETANTLKKWLTNRSDLPINSIEAFLFSILTMDGQEGFLNFSTSEFRQYGDRYLRNVTEQIGSHGKSLFEQICENTLDSYNRAKSCKTALMLSDYIGSLSNKELEKRYQAYFGTIRRVAEQISWVLSSAAELAKTLQCPAEWQKSLVQCAMQIQHGISEDGLFLAQLKIPRLGRERIRKLVNDGITNEKHVVEAGFEYLAKLVTKPVAQSLMDYFERNQDQTRSDNSSKQKAGGELSASNVQSNGGTGIIVNNNHGTIVIHQSAEPVLPSGDINSNGEDLSALPLTTWQQEVTQRLERLPAPELRELYNEVRVMRHNRIQPARDTARSAKTVQQLSDAAIKLQGEYRSFQQFLLEHFHAVLLQNLDLEFAVIAKPRKAMESVRTSFQALIDIITQAVNRLGNLLNKFKTSPEELLLEAITICKPVMNGTAIDTSGLAPDVDRVESIFARQGVIEAFSNLLRNAEASLASVKQPKVILTSRISDERTIIGIQDNGQGIPSTKQSQIFKDGFSTKGSDGFGLAHVKQTVEAHGGSVTLVSSKPRQGTMFEVVL